MLSNTSAVLYGEKDLRIEDRPIEDPGPGEVLVEIGAVGICGSDVHYYEHGRIGEYVVERPMVIGHESAGTIVKVGAGVDPIRVGEAVALEPGVPCRKCTQCLAGRYNLCPDVRFFATPPIDGSITHYITIDEKFAFTAPPSLTLEQAAMAEPVSVGVWAARKAKVTPGDRVLITGAGPIGLFSAQVARAFGATQIVLTDINDFRLGVARYLGFSTANASETMDGKFDVLLECSGAAPALKNGLRALDRAGRAVLIGMGPDEVSIEVPIVQNRELQVFGVFRYANTYPTALELIASGKVDVDAVITHRFTLEQTEDALTLARRVPDSLKAVVAPGINVQS